MRQRQRDGGWKRTHRDNKDMLPGMLKMKHEETGGAKGDKTIEMEADGGDLCSHCTAAGQKSL